MHAHESAVIMDSSNLRSGIEQGSGGPCKIEFHVIPTPYPVRGPQSFKA